MNRPYFISLFLVLSLLGLSGAVKADNALLPTVNLPQALHFLTPAGEDIMLSPDSYEVEVVDSWLKLLPKGEARTAMVLIEALPGSHDEPVTEPVVRGQFDESNPDLFHLAVLLPDGTGWEALGTTSGVRPRGSVLAYLRSKMPSRNPPSLSTRKPQPQHRFAQRSNPVNCGPYSNDIVKQEGVHQPPALAVYQNQLHMIVNKFYDGSNVGIMTALIDVAPPLEHWVYANGQWHLNRPALSQRSQKGVALATLGDKLHMVRKDEDSDQLFHSFFDGEQWTASFKIPNQKSKARPALARFEGALHLVYVGENSIDVLHSIYRDKKWTIPQKTGIKSADVPALAISPIGFRRPLLHMVTTLPVGVDLPLNIRYLFLSAFGGNRWSSAKKIAKEITVLAPSLASTQSGSEKWLQLMHSGNSTQELRQILYGPYQSGRETKVGWFNDQRFLNQKSESSPSVTFLEGCWHMVTVKNDRLLHTTFSTKDVHLQAR